MHGQAILCAADPVVNASVGKLVMVYALCMGVLGCISTGWWTSRSDRVGRVPVLGLGLFGLLFADANFIFVAKFSKSLPGNYWWFVLGALVEGIFGSISTLNATIHAYVADTVEPHSRVHIFSLFYGLIFCGSALGPTVGGLIVRFTGTPLSVFYMGLCIHTRESRRQYDQNILRIQQEATDAPILARFKRLFGFLSPLSVVWETTGRRRSLKAGARGDWSLILMVTSLGVAALLKGSYSYKFQYALAVFGWSSEQLGYLLSVVGFTRAAFLTFILPVIIKLIKPKPPPAPAVQLPETPNEAFGQETETAPLRRNAHAPQSTTQSIVFDLNLMRVSVLIEVVTFLAMPFAGSSLMFSALTVINCFGIGRAPTSQSVSLALYAQRGGTESGKLLGALGVLQIISSQILGPALFGTTFVKTIATNPAAIFFVSALLVGISLTLLLCIRVPETVQDVEEPLDAEESSALHR
ncbi:major facilitator superfamily domain-containing protein [Cristinia sonorae]|uniref:Major facilitator superfamily domain-containing protein n=1 Tax=Cristinia sonorae TaxID=1940300 RepID=A0A8K0XU29_9AGAR|nr:major facilitator superfamily domain-containing protein [Cristinia sonorae]